MRKLKAAIKARKQAQNVLASGLFSPTEHDLKEELSSMPAFHNLKNQENDSL